MSSLESYAQTAPQVLLGSLDYRLPSGAPYIIDRQSSTFISSAAGTFSSGGVRTFRINVTSDQAFADLSTMRLVFRIKNTSPTPDNLTAGGARYILKPKTGPWALIQRLQIYCAGTLVTDILNYGRHHEIWHTLSPKDWKRQEGICDWHTGTAENAWDPVVIGEIANGDVLTVSMPILDGLCTCGKMWPTRFAPIQVVVELAPADWAFCNYQAPGQEAFAAADGAVIQVTDNYILDYQLEDPRIHVDMVTLDSGLANEYAEILLSGKSLTLPINSYFTFQQAILGDNPVVSITRAASRLRHIFMTFEGTLPPGVAAVKSVVNDFSHPRRLMKLQPGQASDSVNFETQFQLGHKKLPHNPMNTVHDYYNQLRRVFGQLWDKEEPLDLEWSTYTKDRFIAAIDCEKALGVAYTGINSRSGDLLTLFLNKMNVPATPGVAARENFCKQVHIELVMEAVVAIRDNSVSVWD